MPSATKHKLVAHIDGLLAEARSIQSSARLRGSMETEPSARFFAKMQHLAILLGDNAKSWRPLLEKGLSYDYDAVDIAVGTLSGIQDLVQGDMLFRVERLAEAEVFSDLLSQAAHLHTQGYEVAAGVLGRAVLEEHLRKWCHSTSCSPAKQRPTINDYNSSLYANKHIDTAAMHHISTLAAIGNDAAHKQVAPKEQIENLLSDVRRFLEQHRIP